MDYKEQLSAIKGTSEVKYNDLPQNVKAREDFRYICEQSNFTVTTNLNVYSLIKNSMKVAEVALTALDLKKGVTTIPAEYVNISDAKAFVGVVCYTDGTPVNVLLITSVLFAHPKKFVKLNKKKGEYIIKVKNLEKEYIKKHTFGVVVEQF